MNIKKLLMILIATFMAITVVYSVQDFSLSTSSVSGTVITDTAGSESITITNTGNESITLTIPSVNVVDGSNSFTVTPSQASLTLAEGASQAITLDYTSTSDTGVYTGTLNISNTANTTQAEFATITITVNTGTVSTPSLIFTESEADVTISGNTIIFNNLEVNDKHDFDLVLLNNGDTTFEKIEFDFEKIESADDEIDDNDLEIEREEASNFEIDRDFNAGDTDTLEFEFELGDIDADEYDDGGKLELRATANGTDYIFNYFLEVTTFSDEEDITFENNEPIQIIVEAGETIDDIDLEIKNSGKNEVMDLVLEVDDDFEQESGSDVLSSTIVSFERTGRFDIDEDDTEDVELTISVPANTNQGTYNGDIRILNRDDDELDEIRIEIKVVGDIFIQALTLPDNAKPNDIIDIEITLRNEGSTIFRDVRIDAVIEDVDLAQSDLDQASDTFLLDTNAEITKRLRFRIPEDATDGEKTVEIEIRYDDNEQILTEIESIRIDREDYMINVESFSVSPNVVKCESSIFTNVRVENLGKFDDRVLVISEIEGTGIKTASNEIDLDVDDDYSFRNTLDISNLEAGVYDVVHTIRGTKDNEVVNTLRIQECNEDGSTTIDLEPLNETEFNNNEITPENTIEIFGTEVETTQAYLGGALVVIVLLIVVSLLML